MARIFNKTIAVLGGGITGLAAAYRLTTLGHRVRLYESSDRLGGAIRTEQTKGWLIEGGPNSFQLALADVADLLRELRLDQDKVEASPAAKNRYLVRGGRLVAAPLSPPGFLKSPLFSVGAKLRVLAEMLALPRHRSADVSVADFVRSHFGRELLDYAVQPLIGGIYAGDPAQLSTRHAFPKLWEMEREHGSILRGQIAAARARREQGEPATSPIVSFRRGLQTLPHALITQLPAETILMNARVDALVRQPAGWTVGWHDGQELRYELFDAVVSALPAGGLARLRVNRAVPLAGLESVFHPPVASLFLGYRREQVGHPLDGFGALVPAVEKRSVLGILFSSSLFPDRAPAGHVALTVMAGGSLQPSLAALPPAELLRVVGPDVRDLLQVTGEPVFLRHTSWPRAIPQYNLGHERHLDALADCEDKNPGLYFAGQVRDGIALPACVQAGLSIAQRADRFEG